jgi:hypothetical protein
MFVFVFVNLYCCASLLGVLYTLTVISFTPHERLRELIAKKDTKFISIDSV